MWLAKDEFSRSVFMIHPKIWYVDASRFRGHGDVALKIGPTNAKEALILKHLFP